ncbi:MAG: NAD-dependent epimerase/dehydratase family protein [Gemmatimonadota bacterium]|jgi:nucleoside-diphosphate-sugar epimerase
MTQRETGRPVRKSDRPLRVFVTGATGYIGSAVVRELAAAGHEVSGLTRWADKTVYLKELGARPVVGDLVDAASYRDVAIDHDVLIHIAEAEVERRVQVDRAAVDGLLGAARVILDHDDDARRMFIYTSGCYVLGETGDRPAGEDASTDNAPELVAWRADHERFVLDAADDRLAAAVIRPGMVYGGHGGAFGALFASAEQNGAAEFVGDGTNHWSPVYVGDVARLYRLVAETTARGIYHCAEDEAARVGNLAVAASRVTSAVGRTRRIRLEDARRSMGAFADALVMDQVMASPRSHALGWRHQHPPFMDSAAAVFAEWRAGPGLSRSSDS